MKAAILNASTLGSGKLTSRLAAALARLVSVAGLPLSELPLSDCASSVTEIRRLSTIIVKQQRPDVHAAELLQQYSLIRQVLQSQAEAQFASLSELDWSENHRVHTVAFVRDLCALAEAFGANCISRAMKAFGEGHCEQLALVAREAKHDPDTDTDNSVTHSHLSMSTVLAMDAHLSAFRQHVPAWEELFAQSIPHRWEAWRVLAQTFCSSLHSAVTAELYTVFEQHSESVDVKKMLNGMLKCAAFEKELQELYPATQVQPLLRAEPQQAQSQPAAVHSRSKSANIHSGTAENPFEHEKSLNSSMPTMQPTMPMMHSTTSSSPPLDPPLDPKPVIEIAKSRLSDLKVAEQPPSEVVFKFHGAISKAFVPYLPLYAKAEASTLNAFLNSLIRSEDPCHSTDDAMVLAGSSELFLAIRSSLQRCSKISESMLLEELYRSAYRPALQRYGRFLCAQASSTTHSVRTLCHIVNTGKYCADTAADLELSLEKKSGSAGCRVHGSWDVFPEAQKIAKQTVVNTIMNAFSPILSRVAENTSNHSGPGRKSKEPSPHQQLGMQGSGFAGGCSMYLDDMVAMFKQYTRTLATHLLDQNFDLVAAEFVDKLTAVYRARLMECTQLSAEDMRLLLNDSGTVTTILIEMEYPQQLQPSGNAAAIQLAMRAMHRIVGMLETLTADKTVMASRYSQLVMNGNAAELKQMVGMVGTLDRREAEAVLSDFNSYANHSPSAADGAAAPSEPSGAGSYTGFNIRGRLRGIKDNVKHKIKSHSTRGGTDPSNLTAVKGGAVS